MISEEKKDLLERSKYLKSLQLSPRATCDFEVLAVGGFHPLRTFMDRESYTSVVKDMRFPDGTFFPIPIAPPVSPEEDMYAGLKKAQSFSEKRWYSDLSLLL